MRIHRGKKPFLCLWVIEWFTGTSLFKAEDPKALMDHMRSVRLLLGRIFFQRLVVCLFP